MESDGKKTKIVYVNQSEQERIYFSTNFRIASMVSHCRLHMRMRPLAVESVDEAASHGRNIYSHSSRHVDSSGSP